MKMELDLDATSEKCFARGCIWDSAQDLTYPSCYVPKEKGGYNLTQMKQVSDTLFQYNLTRISKKPTHTLFSHGHSRRLPPRPPSDVKQLVTKKPNEFSMYNHDVEHLKVDLTRSGPDMMRLTIRDADHDRYEVPVPLHWQPTPLKASNPPRMECEMTKTSNGQVGFRIRRTDTRTLLFDTSLFAHGFIYDEKFLQFVTTIPSRNIYGKTMKICS